MKKSLFLLTFLLLSACFFSAEKDIPAEDGRTELMKKVLSEQSLPHDVSFEMNILNKSAEKLQVQLLLKNPSRQKIASIRSWVSFPPDILKGLKLEFPENAPVTLIAPGEDTFDNDQGVAKIGLSVKKEWKPEEILPFATLTFERLQNKTGALSFFDVRDTGHTDVLVFHEGEPRSVLKNENMEPLVVETVEE